VSDGLKSFKISDQRKKPIEKATKKDATPPSVGFPKIEALIEQDSPDLSGLHARKQALDEMTSSATTPKDKAAAKRAAEAYAKSLALIDSLLATKAKMAGKA
jgi:hypothetical protein